MKGVARDPPSRRASPVLPLLARPSDHYCTFPHVPPLLTATSFPSYNFPVSVLAVSSVHLFAFLRACLL